MNANKSTTIEPTVLVRFTCMERHCHCLGRNTKHFFRANPFLQRCRYTSLHCAELIHVECCCPYACPLHDNRTKFRTQESSSLRWQKASTKADLSICSLVPHVGRLVSARGRLPDATRGSDQRPERLFHKIGHPSGLCLDCLDGTSCQSLGRLPVPNPAWEIVPKKSEVKPSDLFSSPLCYTTGMLNKHEQTTFHDVA